MKSVVKLTDRPDMTLDVYRGRKTTIQSTNNVYSAFFFFFHISTFTFYEFSENRLLSVSRNPIISEWVQV